MWGLRAVTSIRELFNNSLILYLLGWIPMTQFSVKLFIASARSLIDVITLEIINGLKALSSKWPFDPPTVQAT